VGTVGAFQHHLEAECRVAACIRSLPSRPTQQPEPVTPPDASISERHPATSSSSKVGASSGESLTQTDDHSGQDDQVITGDFWVISGWSSADKWGDDVPLAVVAGDTVYISEVDPQGWALAKKTGGETGWMPFSICRRRVYKAVEPYNGDESCGYSRIAHGDRLEVFHRDDTGWCYGARLLRLSDGADSRHISRGWFPSSVVK